jgi:hypothetical protein
VFDELLAILLSISIGNVERREKEKATEAANDELENREIENE